MSSALSALWFGWAGLRDTKQRFPHSSCHFPTALGTPAQPEELNISLEEKDRAEGGFGNISMDFPWVWQAGERSWNRKVRWMRSSQAPRLPQGCLMYQRARTKCAISAASWAASVTLEVLMLKTCAPQRFSQQIRASSFQSWCEFSSPSYLFDKKQPKLSIFQKIQFFSGEAVSF